MTKKAVIILSGSPEAKTKFDEIAKQFCFIWNANPKNWLTRIARQKLYLESDREDETYQKFMSDFLSLVNSQLDFEKKYINQLIDKLLADEEEKKALRDEEKRFVKDFNVFLLVIHGISRELTESLKAERGAFQLHVTSKRLQTNEEEHDYVLYLEENFEQNVKRVINILTGEN